MRLVLKIKYGRLEMIYGIVTLFESKCATQVLIGLHFDGIKYVRYPQVYGRTDSLQRPYERLWDGYDI